MLWANILPTFGAQVDPKQQIQEVLMDSAYLGCLLPSAKPNSPASACAATTTTSLPGPDFLNPDGPTDPAPSPFGFECLGLGLWVQGLLITH